MNIAPINNHLSKTRNLSPILIKRINSSPSFGDIDGDRIILGPKIKPHEIRALSPEWDKLRAQGKLLLSKRSKLYEHGKNLIQEGYIMKHRTQELQVKAQTLSKESQVIYDEAFSLLEDAIKHDFQTYRNKDRSQYWSKREIERSWDGTTITEYDDEDEGEVLRRVKISDDKVKYEKMNYFSGAVTEYVFDRDSRQLTSLTIGKKDRLRGGYDAEELYTYDCDGNLFEYAKDYEITKNADVSADQYYIFDSKHIKTFYLNYYSGGSPHTTSASKVLEFANGEFIKANIFYRDITDKETRIGDQYLHDTHGNITTYAHKLKQEGNGLTSAEHVFGFKSGVVDSILVDYKAFSQNGTASAKKKYTVGNYGHNITSCSVNNQGLFGANHQINDCMSEKIATYGY
ncbi:MAG: hypothetical protein IJB79_03310 [Candidatus Gastranaerophilales bacterium]|nr:hypothetical protein [Candidatus Gastranaerophilales bacterium]